MPNDPLVEKILSIFANPDLDPCVSIYANFCDREWSSLITQINPAPTYPENFRQLGRRHLWETQAVNAG